MIRLPARAGSVARTLPSLPEQARRKTKLVRPRGRTVATEAAIFTFSGTAGSLFVTGHVLAGAAVTVLYLGLRYLRFRRLLMRYIARSKYAGLATVVPVAPLHPDMTADPDVGAKNAGVALKMLREAADRAPRVDLMLASGWRVIGCENSPGWLYEQLRDRRVERLRVLVLSRDSPAFDERGQYVMPNQPPAKYRAGAQAVLWTLRAWKRELSIPIEVREYWEDPIWQMFILPKDVWVLQAAGYRSTDSSPMFVLRRRQKFGLGWGFEAVWERRWEHDDTKECDLEQVTEPNWHDVVDL